MIYIYCCRTQRARGEEVYYFGARYYDADIGLWTSTDPKEQFHTPYAYTGNGINPIIGVDPDGQAIGMFLQSGKGSGNAFGHGTFYVGNSRMGHYVFDFGPGSGRKSTILGRSVDGVMDMAQLLDVGSKGDSWLLRTSLNPSQWRTADKWSNFQNTSELQDFGAFYLAFSKMMRVKSGDEKYNLYSNSCTSVFTDAAKGVGIDVGGNYPDRVHNNAVNSGAADMKPVERNEQ
ncbi:MAG: RHS repeat-associated core domain-containing protein [Chitinivibrionales bacterium]